FGMLHMVVEAEIEGRVRIGGGDDVPAGAAARDVVERGKPTRDVIGLVKRGRAGRDQSNVFGCTGKRRQQRERFERGDGVAALERIDRHVQDGQVVGHEEGVELAGLEVPDQLLQMRETEVGVRPGSRIAPGAGVDTDRPHEGAEFQLTLCHGRVPKLVIVRDKWGYAKPASSARAGRILPIWVASEEQAPSLRAKRPVYARLTRASPGR